MTTFALIHGGSSAGFYWDRVVPRLVDAGHTVVAPDLPAGDPAADFIAYADAVDAALEKVPGFAEDLVVVGQSMGGFTAPVVASRHSGARIVLVAPMIPQPGETPGQYFQHVDLETAQRDAAKKGGYDPSFDVQRIFLHDVAPEVAEQLMVRGEPEQAETIFAQPFPVDEWPDAPTRVIACTEDRMFPLPLVTRVARDRLDVQVEPLHSGHLAGFSHPDQLAQLILRGEASQ